MRRTAVLLTAVLALASCEDENRITTPTPVTTLGPQRASINFTQVGTAQICSSPVKSFRIGVPLLVDENAGVGFYANFARLTLLRGSTVIDVSELGVNEIKAQRGTNHFLGGSFFGFVALFDFNRSDSTSADLLFDFTDDKGNHIEKHLTTISPVVVTPYCAF